MTPTGALGSGIDAEMGDLLVGSLRGIFAATEEPAEVTAAIYELGWNEVREADAATATTLLFVEHGRALAVSTLLDEVLLHELGSVLPHATGRRGVLYPDPDDIELGRIGGPVRGLLLTDPSDLAELVVPLKRGEETVFVVFDANTVRQAATPIQGFDPSVGWFRVEFFDTPSDVLTIPDTDHRWPLAEAAGRRALSAEIAGVCAGAIDVAVAHTTARHQYGRPLASFQAVRHRLAEAHVATAAARATLEAAWDNAGDAQQAPWAARVAKMRAGRAQSDVMRHTVQVLGAMGLTEEAVMHRYVARAAILDLLLGGYATLSDGLGEELLAGAEALPLVHIETCRR